jgi:hypothetical protein
LLLNSLDTPKNQCLLNETLKAENIPVRFDWRLQSAELSAEKGENSTFTSPYRCLDGEFDGKCSREFYLFCCQEGGLGEEIRQKRAGLQQKGGKTP